MEDGAHGLMTPHVAKLAMVVSDVRSDCVTIPSQDLEEGVVLAIVLKTEYHVMRMFCVVSFY